MTLYSVIAALVFAGSALWPAHSSAQENPAILVLYHPQPPASGEMSYRYLCHGGSAVEVDVAMDGKGTLRASRLSFGAADGSDHLETLNGQLSHLLWVSQVRADCTGSGLAVTFLGTYWPSPDNVERAVVTLMWAGGDSQHVLVEGPTLKLPPLSAP